MMVIFEAALSRFLGKGQVGGVALANAALSMSLAVLMNVMSVVEILYLFGFAQHLVEKKLPHAHMLVTYLGVIVPICFLLTYRAQLRVSARGLRDPRSLNAILVGYLAVSVVAFLVLSVIVFAKAAGRQ